MKRPLFVCTLALLAGVYTAYLVPDLISVLFLGFLIYFLFILLFFKKPVLLWLCVVLCFAFGAFCILSVGDIHNRPLYAYMDEYVTVQGEVVEEVEVKDDGRQIFLARLTFLEFLDDALPLDERVQLTVPAGEIKLSFGDTFSAVSLFSIPQGRQNSGAFDYELYLKSKKIFFVGKVEKQTLKKTGRFSLSPLERLYDLNRRCCKAISSLMPENAAAVLRAISFGEKSAISDELQKSLEVSGLSHMVAVSGMHITTLMSVVFVFLTLLKRNKYKYFLPVCGVVFLFMLFAGGSPSLVRGAIMSLLMLVARLCFRKEDAYTSLGIAAAIIVLINPFTAFDSGFILSFGATLGILLIAAPLQKRLFSIFRFDKRRGHSALKGIVSAFCVTFSVQLFLLPVLSVMFGYVSLWSFITTLLAAPLLAGLLVGGLAVGFLGLFSLRLALPVAGFVYPLVKLFLQIVMGFGQLDFGIVTVGAFGAFGVYVYALCLIAFHRLLYKRYLQAAVFSAGIPLLLACCLVTGILFPRAEVTFINVGQGDCTLLRLPGNTSVLVDGGGVTYDTDYDVGEEVVVPYLRRAGIRKLSYIIATHPHGDHIGGLQAVVDSVSAEMLLVPVGFDSTEEGRAFLRYVEEKEIPVKKLIAGDTVELGKDSQLEVLLPDAAWLSMTEQENDLSLVFRFCYGDNSVLFMGDLEADGENYLLSRYDTLPESTILKVGHHGSEHGTGNALLHDIKPAYAYIPCGKNHFGHPSPRVLERLLWHGTTVYRGDEDCDVTFVFNKNDLQSIIKGGKIPS